MNVSPYAQVPNPGSVNAPPIAGPYIGLLAYLVPYIEQQNIYDMIPGTLFDPKTAHRAWMYNDGPFDSGDASVPPGKKNGTGRGYPRVANEKIATFLCPSDSQGGGIQVCDAFGYDYGLFYIDWVYNVFGYGAELGAVITWAWPVDVARWTLARSTRTSLRGVPIPASITAIPRRRKLISGMGRPRRWRSAKHWGGLTAMACESMRYRGWDPEA